MKLITTMRDTLQAIIDAASVLGVFMMGALIATMINFEITWAPTIGEKVIDIQDIMNTIFPRLVPAVFTGFVFWLLGRKGMNSTKAILIIITLALALSAFGHFVLGMS